MHRWRLPDSKFVEGTHQTLRLSARANVNRRLSFRNNQTTVSEIEVSGKRGFPPYRCKVGTETRVKEFYEKSRSTQSRHMYETFRHRLKAAWGCMMLPRKTRPTLSEDTMQRVTAAWAWLHALFDMRGRGLSLVAARMSELVPPCVVLRGTQQHSMNQ